MLTFLPWISLHVRDVVAVYSIDWLVFDDFHQKIRGYILPPPKKIRSSIRSLKKGA